MSDTGICVHLPKSETRASKAEGLTPSVSEQTDRSTRRDLHFTQSQKRAPGSRLRCGPPVILSLVGGWAREALLQLPSGFSWQEDFRAKGHRLN